MFYLLLNVVFASTFTLCIKWVQNREREDIVMVGAINYIVAAVWILPGFLSNEVASISTSAVLTGITMGSCYFVAFFFVIHAVKWVGAAGATAIGVLSILFPITCGVFLWNAQPNMYQVVGIVLALLALSLIGGKQTDEEARARPWFTPIVLISFFLVAGVSRLAQEAFKHISQPDQRPTFLFAAFFVATVPSIALLVFRRSRFLPLEIIFGVVMGSANILQTHFILKSLQYFAGFVVFPITSAGALILTTVVATRMLGERLNRQTYLGIAIAILALVLLNWLPSEY